ncbi:MAG: putative short chain dehydrogenase [Verrucomicrobiales bacterium]|nr:putative short chain dehydrogenase [Verrucomicrobiales bacterium]
MKRLENKIAIVSGAANGIGRAVAEVFAEEGAWVLVTDMDGATAEKVAAEICSKGGKAASARVDIRNAEEIQNAVKIVSDQFGRVDVLVNNAAYIGQWHDVLNATDEEWSGCLQGTLLGTQRFTKSVLPWMIPQNRGSIIITSSIQGLVACPNSVSYTTVKAGLIGFARSAACDYGKNNIRVNVIAPGPIRVGYSPKPGEPGHTYQIKNTFLGRTGETRDVGYAALFLASEESSFITGTVLPVDGGWTAM